MSLSQSLSTEEQGDLFTESDAEDPVVRWSVGDRVWWDSKALGRCVGSIVGVHEAGVTARRDGVTPNTRPHSLLFGSFNEAKGFNSQILTSTQVSRITGVDRRNVTQWAKRDGAPHGVLKMHVGQGVRPCCIFDAKLLEQWLGLRDPELTKKLGGTS